MAKGNFPTFILAAGLVLFGHGARAQDDATFPSDEDIFASGAFDQAVSEGKTASDSAALSWLGGVTLVAGNQTTVFQDTGNYLDMASLTGKAFLKATAPDVSSLFVSYSFSHTLLQATNDKGLQSALAASQPDLYSPDFTLSELHLSFDVNKVVFVRVGNQLLSWSSSFFWSPADFVNERQADSQASVDTRAGKSGVRLHVPLRDANLFFFTDFSRTIDAEGIPQDISKKAGYAFRADATFAGFNTGVLGAAGPGEPTRLGLSTSGTLFGLDVWGEAGAVIPLYDYEYSLAASAGGEKAFGESDEWNVRGEFFYNGAGEGDTVLTPYTVFVPYKLGVYYGYLSGTRAKLFGGDSSLSLTGIMNFSDLSWTASAMYGLNMPKLIPVNFTLRYSGGRNDREFTVKSGGPAWTFDVKSVVQF